MLTGENLTPLGERRRATSLITFGDRDVRHRTTSQDEPMVISVVVVEYQIERKMGLPQLTKSLGALYGFSGERVPIKGTVELDTVFGEGSSLIIIPVLYTNSGSRCIL
ncbi:hypothetical protein CR513_32011, partial [Mucuna pruriens]